MTDALPNRQTDEKPWTEARRLMIWIKVTAMALPIATAMATCAIATAKWGWTRASLDDVTQAVESRESKESARKVEATLDAKIDVHQKTLDNVRDNLFILMGRQGVEPKKPDKP